MENETESLPKQQQDGDACALLVISEKQEKSAMHGLDGHMRKREAEVARAAKTCEEGGHDGQQGKNDPHHPQNNQRVARPPPTISTSYTSTTDEDDGMFFHRPSTSGSGSSYGPGPLPLSPATLLQRRRSNRTIAHPTPIMVQTPADLTLDEEWDYSETEWWGWVILIVTWLVFVVGMGSCLDIWSWAWDVGETPYAPPELEDDPTLPITGYYPALMVCTVVMAWIWVVVAWVGMKYFRHAKVVADDG